MYAVDFEYANRRLSDFGCVMCHMNTSKNFEETDIGCDITFTTVKNSQSSKQYITSSAYDNVYTTTFDIIKYNCTDSNDSYMTSLEARGIIKWLNRHEYHKFRVINEIADESDVHYYGSFNIEEIFNGDKIVGLTLTFTSNAPYGFATQAALPFMLMNAGDTFELYGDSDDMGVIYPTISVRSLYECEELRITNENTQNYVLLFNCAANEVITIDGEHKLITTNNKEHEKTLPNDFNYEYFEIVIDECDSCNRYKVSAPCEITIHYSPIRKVGVY